MKKTNLEKYGVESVLQKDSIIQKKNKTMLNRYGDEHFNNKSKEYETKRKNGTFNTSIPEQKLFELLKQEFGDQDVINHYNDDRYPFECDFYIKSKDIFIEYHGTWTHGGHPFNCNDENDKLILNKWISKNYQNAIYTWTDLDVRKKSYQNKINLIIFYPDEHDDIVSSFMKIKAELDSYRK